MSEIRARLAAALEDVVLTGDSASGYILSSDKEDILDALTPAVEALVAAKDAEIQRLKAEPNALALGLAYATEKDKRERLERRIAAVLALPPPAITGDAFASGYVACRKQVRALLTDTAKETR